jgi:hypothetical protein
VVTLVTLSLSVIRLWSRASVEHACRLGAEGIVSKRVDGTYRSGPCPAWIKVRNPASVAVQRERSEKWNR